MQRGRLAAIGATGRGRLGVAKPPRGEWARVSFPLLASSALGVALAQGDVLLVGATLGRESTGIYAAAVRIAYLVGLPLLAVSAAVVPALSRDLARGELALMEARYRRAARLATALAVVGGAVCWVAGPWLLRLIGSEFEAGTTVLRLVILGQVAQSAIGPVEQVLGATGHQDAALVVFAASSAAFVAMTVGGSLLWGLSGAAVGAMTGQLLWRGALAVVMARRLGVRAGAW